MVIVGIPKGEDIKSVEAAQALKKTLNFQPNLDMQDL